MNTGPAAQAGRGDPAAVPVRPVRRRGFRLRILSIVTFLLLLTVGVVAATLWWHDRQARLRPLEPGWPVMTMVLAGDGVMGVRDGTAASARFAEPFGVAVGVDGTVYVADAGDAPRIRALSTDGGGVRTIAGGVGHGLTNGAGAGARFGTLSGLAIDALGTLYVADTGNNVIRRVMPDGTVSTYAGDGVAGDSDGPAHAARFNGPIGVAVDATGRVLVADTYNDRIRAIAPDGTVTTVAGGIQGFADAVGLEARFDTPSGVAIDTAGRIYVADTGNGVVRIIDRDGRVSTPPWFWTEGLVRPIGIAVSPGGDVYVTDDRGRILEAAANGVTRVLTGSRPGFRDGIGTQALFRTPTGVAYAGPGRLIVADAGNALVRLVAAGSRLTKRTPASPFIAPRFDAERFGWWPLLWPVAPMEGPHEIAGTMGEARGGASGERFHAGVDVRAEEGTAVQAVRDGIVSSPIASHDFGTLNESLRIGPMVYVHMRAGRTRDGTIVDPTRFVASYDETGKLKGIRVKRGARFTTGEPIGTVNAFNHVHMNVGWPGEESNPLGFELVRFEDTIPPTIARGGVRLFDDRGQPLTRRLRGRVMVSGRVQVVVDAWDQADGNRPSRRLGLYDLGYQVLHPDGTPAPGFETMRHTQRFDHLAVSPEAPRLVYAPGSGIPFYGGRRTRFLYVVTNTFHDGAAAQGYWDTTLLPPGPYILRAWAADIRGNEALTNREVPVMVVPWSPADNITLPIPAAPGAGVPAASR